MATNGAYADWNDVQKGFEKPIPTGLQPKVDEFLARASRRLRVTKRTLQAALDNSLPDSDLSAFVKDMVVEAGEMKLRNFGGFSSESAGVFSVTRYEDFAKGKIRFDPDDLALLDEMLDDKFGATVRGPVKIGIPSWRIP